MDKPLEIRNSTAEFLIFVMEGKENGVEVLYKDESIWATQKAIATLFDVNRTVITKHLKNIFESSELQRDSVCAKMAHTAEDMATRHIPMTMEDWAKRIDRFLDTTDRPVLADSGKITAEYAKGYAESEFEKYRAIQDKMFHSDFDRFNGDGLIPLDFDSDEPK